MSVASARWVSGLVAGAAGCAAAARTSAVPPRIDVTTTACPDPGEARARLAAVVADRGDSDGLVVRVDDADERDRRQVRLRVIDADGEVGVDRIYPLGPTDCASATAVLAVGVERFLAALPGWGGPAPTPRPTARWLELSLVSAVSAIGRPAGVEGQVGAVLDRGTRRDRIGGGVLVRASLPQAAGPGQFQQTSILAAARYRRRVGRWQGQAGARAGALIVSGLGFTENRSDLLPWWEGYLAGARSWSWGTIGLEVAASGLRHRAVTGDGSVGVDVPLVRVGLAVEFDLIGRRP